MGRSGLLPTCGHTLAAGLLAAALADAPSSVKGFRQTGQTLSGKVRIWVCGFGPHHVVKAPRFGRPATRSAGTTAR